MFNCYDTISRNWKATSCMWELVKKSQTNRVFQITDRTVKQMANAGGFRLLRKEDSDSIISYESQFSAFADFQSTAFQEAQDNVRNTFSMVVDFKANSQIRGTSVGDDTVKMNLALPLLF
jgi:ribonucleotide monophosphatase NagD (HAD superfamily)